MAEIGNSATNLDLYHDIFNFRTPREELAVTVEDVNNVGDVRIKKQSHSNTILDSSILNCEHDSSFRIQTNSQADLEEGSSFEDSVRLHNIENLRKKTQSSASVIQGAEDNKINVNGNEKDSEQTNLEKGTANIVQENDHKQCTRKKKEVSFPKDTIISGYLDPPDPWKNALPWTTDELVSAYRKSCEFLGTKPLSKLIQQLQAINPLGKKHEELLTLKGDKLDQKQCECLEEILKRVQFKFLDLEASHLDDESAVAIFDMIEYYESACQLSIAFNKNIQARGWQACARLIRRTPSLTSLDIRSCDLNERTIPIFGRALKLGCHLTVLHMENMNLSGRPLLILVAALKMNTTLQELYLSENKLVPTDGVQLGNLLCYNHKLSLLDLRNNHLQDVGTKHISEGLMAQKKGTGLRTLVLWNNSINYQAMSVLGRALASSQNLETLNIGHNAITNEGVHQLKDGLLRVNSLLRLGLQGTKLSDEGAVALAEYIAETIVLLRIDLRDNDIKTGGLMALSLAMRVNTSVTRIDLDKEPKKEPGMKDYVEQQSRLLRDILTYQQRNDEIALIRVEQERAKKQENVKAEAATTNKEADLEQQITSIPSNSSTESFTLIDDVNDQEIKTKSEEFTNEIEIAKVSVESFSGEISVLKSNTDVLQSPVYEQDEKHLQRPSTLGLPEEVAVTSSVSDLSPISSASEPIYDPLTQSTSPSQTDVSTVSTSCSTPAEMILSPQYFPKQITRKIFSVIRVQEDHTCVELSSSSSTLQLTKTTEDDPLNVSPLLLIPVVSSPSSLVPFSMPVIQCAEKLPLHLKPGLQVTSPGASLFKDLAEETIKHMVSPETIKNVVSPETIKHMVFPETIKHVVSPETIKRMVSPKIEMPGHAVCSNLYSSSGNHNDSSHKANYNHESSYQETDNATDSPESSNEATGNTKVIIDSYYQAAGNTILESSYQAPNTFPQDNKNSLEVMEATKCCKTTFASAIDNHCGSLSIKDNNESLHKTKDTTKENLVVNEDNVSENSTLSYILDPSVTHTELFTSLEGESLPVSLSNKEICTNPAKLLFKDKDKMSATSVSNVGLCSDNSQNDHAFIKDSVASHYKSLLPENKPDRELSSDLPLISQVCKAEQLSTDAGQVGRLENDLTLVNSEAVFLTGAGNCDAEETDIYVNYMKTGKQICNTSCNSPFFSLEEDPDNDTVISVGKSPDSNKSLSIGESINNGTIFSIAESNDNDAIFSIDDNSDSNVIDSEPHNIASLLVKDAIHSVQDSKKEILFHDSDSNNFQSMLLSNEKNVYPVVTDFSMPIEPVSACLNNFSSPSLLLPEITEDLSPVCLWERADSNQLACGDYGESSFSSIVDLIKPGSSDNCEMKDRKLDALMGSLGDSSNNLTYDSLDDIVSINNMASDNADIEIEDYILDEEPWLTVGIDSEGVETETARKPSKQPDFFTTLSLNGLTQELASALTSLDGSTSPFDVESYDSGKH